MLSSWLKEPVGSEDQAAGVPRKGVYMQAIRVSLKDPVHSVVTMRLILPDTESNLRVRLTYGCQFYCWLMAPVYTYKYVFFGFDAKLWGTLHCGGFMV